MAHCAYPPSSRSNGFRLTRRRPEAPWPGFLATLLKRALPMSRLEPARSGWQDPILGGTSDRRRLGPRPDPRRARPPCSSSTIGIRACLAAPKFRGFIHDRTSSRTIPMGRRNGTALRRVNIAPQPGPHTAAAGPSRGSLGPGWRGPMHERHGWGANLSSRDAEEGIRDALSFGTGTRGAEHPAEEPPKRGGILRFVVSFFSTFLAYFNQNFLFCNCRLRYAYGITA